jgi:hypothetical protein
MKRSPAEVVGLLICVRRQCDEDAAAPSIQQAHATRLCSVKAGANTIWTAKYSEEGLRTRKTEFRGPDFFDHKYSYGPGGLLWDSHPNHVFTPGWGHRSNGINTFYHSDWLGSTRCTSDITASPSRFRSRMA